MLYVFILESVELMDTLPMQRYNNDTLTMVTPPAICDVQNTAKHNFAIYINEQQTLHNYYTA